MKTMEECKGEYERILAQNDQNKSKVLGIHYDFGSIDLLRDEEYDASRIKCWSFRKSEDVRNGISNNLGNMCSGYPFMLNGIRFPHSEGAYEFGMFSDGSEAAMDVQRQILAEPNGFMVKKRVKRHNMALIRSDWEEFRIQWMLYVVWNKCIGNQAFANILRQIPDDVMIIEDSSAQHGDTAMLWGTKNMELKAGIKAVEDYIEISNPLRMKKIINNEKMIQRNMLTCIGVFRGKNVMGKILKLCQIALLHHTVPPIDETLLERKHICMQNNHLSLYLHQAA